MNFELAARLKKAGFPQREPDWYTGDGQYIVENERWYVPSTRDLLEACGDGTTLIYMSRSTIAHSIRFAEEVQDTHGATPDEALGNLWLAQQPFEKLLEK